MLAEERKLTLQLTTPKKQHEQIPTSAAYEIAVPTVSQCVLGTNSVKLSTERHCSNTRWITLLMVSKYCF